MNKTTISPFSDGGDESDGIKTDNLPDERTEVNLKNTIIRFLKENVEFTGSPENIHVKLLELTVGLYDLFIANQLPKRK